MKCIEDHACAVWLGDLNYRLHLSGKPDEQVWRLIRERHLEKLIEADELRREMAAGRVFKVRVCGTALMAETGGTRDLASAVLHPSLCILLQGWREAPVTFAPTFKFKVGTHLYLGEAGSGGVPATEEEDGGGEGPGRFRMLTSYCYIS